MKFLENYDKNLAGCKAKPNTVEIKYEEIMSTLHLQSNEAMHLSGTIFVKGYH